MALTGFTPAGRVGRMRQAEFCNKSCKGPILKKGKTVIDRSFVGEKKIQKARSDEKGIFIASKVSTIPGMWGRKREEGYLGKKKAFKRIFAGRKSSTRGRILAFSKKKE